MPNRRSINSVLHNFLGTFTSRNTDYDGYWLFGLLLAEGFEQLSIDLLNLHQERASGLTEFTRQLAVQKFAEQVEKARLKSGRFREAQLQISKIADPIQGMVNGQTSSGYGFKFLIRASFDPNKIYERKHIVFVAPHNWRAERRSTRRIWTLESFFRRLFF